LIYSFIRFVICFISYITHACFLTPYPLALTCDTNGNVIIWGTKGSAWEGKRIAGFLNVAPVHAEYEPRVRPAEKEEEEPPSNGSFFLPLKLLW
jgi:hypothetical protein